MGNTYSGIAASTSSPLSDDVIAAVNAAAAKHHFSCVPVSWDDAQRGTVGGALSCWGGNISDVRLWEKTGKLLFTCRSQNWNERLGYVSAKDVAVVVGNHAAGGSPPVPVTLQKYLMNFGEYAGYAGSKTPRLFVAGSDDLCTIRFQTVFLPIAKGTPTNFCTEVYNYNTHSDDNPRNVLLLCTAQGTSVQQDGSGAKRIFHHEVDRDSTVHRYWLEAEKTDHKVGGSQVESAKEAQEAAARGKSTSIHIGTRAMGTRFNVQMLIQVPVKQQQVPRRDKGFMLNAAPCSSKMSLDLALQVCQESESIGASCAAELKKQCELLKSMDSKMDGIGATNAARVSRGDHVDQWYGLTKKSSERDPSMHPTITVTMYYTVVGGVPSAADVEAAVADLDALYSACSSSKPLADCTEVTKELTVKDAITISQKCATQPYVPPTFAAQASAFPE